MPHLRYLRYFVILLLFLNASAFSADPIDHLVKGPPVNESQIGKSAYLALKGKRAPDARFLWINFSLLEDENIEIPATGFTPKLEHEYENAFHWIIPDSHEDSKILTGEERALHPSFMGGTGIGSNYGDGRAAVQGRVQHKYLGQTGFSANDGDFIHFYGRGPLSRAITEGTWGEVAQDFPYGANRLFSISDRGTDTLWPNGGKEREGLATREVPTRPAHYFEKFEEPKPGEFSAENAKLFKTLDHARIREAIRALPDALPKPPGFNPATATKGEKLRAGLFEYTDRLAEQYSFEVANRFFKADVSSSNFEINGRLLDYDSMTAQPFYTYLETPIGDALGKNQDLKDWLLSYFPSALNRYSPGDLAKKAPKLAELNAHFDEQYQMRLRRNFVELTGLPKGLVAEMAESPEGRAEISSLGQHLHKIAFRGSENFVLTDVMPEKAPTYDLPRILVDLASKDPLDPEALAKILEKDLPNPELRKALVERYSTLMRRAIETARSKGISIPHLQTYTYENAKIRNADISDMHRPTLRKESEKLIDEYLKTGDRTKVWDAINYRIQQNRRIYQSEDPFELVIMENRNPVHGITARHIYSAHQGEFEVVVQAKIHGDRVRFFSHEIPLGEISGTKLHSSANEWRDPIHPKIHEKYVEFRIPAQKNVETVKMSLESADGKHWWKMGNQDAEIKFAVRNSIPAHPASLGQTQLPELILAPDRKTLPPPPEKSRSLLNCILKPVFGN